MSMTIKEKEQLKEQLRKLDLEQLGEQFEKYEAFIYELIKESKEVYKLKEYDKAEELLDKAYRFLNDELDAIQIIIDEKVDELYCAKQIEAKETFKWFKRYMKCCTAIGKTGIKRVIKDIDRSQARTERVSELFGLLFDENNKLKE
ncbi:hypothetical protein [Helicobacter cetorum]|uniref:hypothetical protein n=1 Tax=Helicobacter cetorum TaxID=138563 RepID=UPI000CF1B160|nr:hypothetical protein [Helicobacter cetorum]